MVKHQSVILLLLHNFASLLVEDAAQTVEGLVESAADEPSFVKSEIQFLVLKGIEHVCDLLPHPSGYEQGSHYDSQRNRRNYDQYDLTCHPELVEESKYYISSASHTTSDD